MAGNIFRGTSTLIAGAEEKKSFLFETTSTGKRKFAVKYEESAEAEDAISTAEALIGVATAAIGVAETEESAATTAIGVAETKNWTSI